MRIVKNGVVHVSAPYGMPKRDIEAFVEQHREWINEARRRTAEGQEQRAAFYGQLPLSTRAQKNEALLRLKALVEPMVVRHAKVMGVSPTDISYKRMVSRWGICKIKEHSICFSFYLLLLPEWCVEHVVVHELCHLLEPNHSARFHAFMDQYFPMWREARKETRRVVKGA